MSRHLTRWRAQGSVAQASVALLGVGVIIITVIVWQTLSAARARQAAVERLARDYSAVAAWSFHRFANASLHSGMEHLMHPVHPSEDGASGPYGAGELLAAHQHSDAGCPIASSGRVGAAISFRLRGHPQDVELAGTLPDGLTAELIVQRLTDVARQDYAYEWMSALELVPVGTALQPLAYYARRMGADTAVWGIPVDVDALGGLFASAAFGHDLLPPSLTGPMAADEFLSLAAWTPDGRHLWRSRASDDQPASETTLDLGVRWSGLRVAAVTLPQAAPRLAIGGPPPDRLPVTVGLLLLTVGLLTVALANLRRAADLTRLRSDFVSSVSHDLRTPLALQRVAIDTLRLGRARDAGIRQQALTNIDREATRLTHLVDNLLRFSRAESGTGQLRREMVDLGSVVERTVNVFSEIVDPADAAVAMDIEPVHALADADGLTRVLLNLLENAVKYGKPGQTIRVGLTKHGGHATISVEDEGPGVDPAERELIWEPFSRGASALRSAAAGSGIGLSVVREIIAAHGGSTRVRDAEHGGARFELHLPLVDCPR